MMVSIQQLPQTRPRGRLGSERYLGAPHPLALMIEGGGLLCFFLFYLFCAAAASRKRGFPRARPVPCLYFYITSRRYGLGNQNRRAPGGAPYVTRDGRSGLATGEAHRRRAGAVVGLDIDEADHALLDLLPGTLQGRADVLGLFDIFGVAAERLGHLVVAR